MAVHVLDAICKLLEDMPCLRHFRRCTVLAKWPRGHVALSPQNTGLEEVEVDSVHQTLLLNVAKLHPRDLHRSTTYCYLRLFVWSCLILFDLVWSWLCYFDLFCVSKSSVHLALKRLALFESALFAVRNGLQQITSTAHGRPRGTKSPAKRMRTDDRMIRNRSGLQMFAVWSDQFNRLHVGFDRPILKLKSLTQGNHLMNQI